MTFFDLWRIFCANYALGKVDAWKGLLIYPFFKLQFWEVYGTGWKKRIATDFFSILPTFRPITVKILGFGNRRIPVPIWLTVSDRLTSFQEIFISDAYAPSIRIARHAPPDFLIDAGANVGYASLYLAAKLPVKTILAIEPNPHLAAALLEIQSVLSYAGVQMHIAQGALTTTDARFEMTIRSNSRVSSLALSRDGINSGENSTSVQGRSLAGWIRTAGLESMIEASTVLLKIDIEGYEFDLIAQDPSLLKLADYLILEIHGKSENRRQLVDRIRQTHDQLQSVYDPAFPEVEVIVGAKSA